MCHQSFITWMTYLLDLYNFITYQKKKQWHHRIGRSGTWNFLALAKTD